MFSKLHWPSVGICWKFTAQEVKAYSKTTAAGRITEPSRLKAHSSTRTHRVFATWLICVFLRVSLYFPTVSTTTWSMEWRGHKNTERLWYTETQLDMNWPHFCHLNWIWGIHNYSIHANTKRLGSVRFFNGFETRHLCSPRMQLFV